MLQSPTPHMREALPGEPPRTRNARPSRRLLHFRGHQHLAIAVRLHGRYEPRLLHLLDEACRTVVANPQMALNERDRCAPRAHHDLHGLIVKRIGFSTRFAEAQLGSAVGCVARIRCTPAARAFWARRAISSSTFLPDTIIRSASSSMMTTM